MNDQLKKYIQKMRQEGVSDEKIQKNLEEAGWEQSQIKGFFEKNKSSSDVPAPPRAKTPKNEKGWHKLLDITPYVIPLLIVVLILIMNYILPAFRVNPSYDFLYYTSDRYTSYVELEISSEGVAAFTCRTYSYNSDYYRKRCDQDMNSLIIYRYDSATGDIINVPKEELEEYEIVSKSVSPDGYVIEGQYGDNILEDIADEFFSSEPDRDVVLRKGKLKKEIDIKTGSYYGYGPNFNFIGWVK